MSLAQIAALVIFIAMFALIITDKFERQWVTLVSGGLMLAVVFGAIMHSGSAIIETLNLRAIGTPVFWYAKAEGESGSTGINWSTIILSRS